MKQLIALLCGVGVTLAQPTFPVEIKGNLANTELESFAVDDSGNLAVACITSDSSLVSSSNTNIALYWPTSTP